MNQYVSNDLFFPVEKIRRNNRQEEVKAAVVIDKRNALEVKEQFEHKEARLREELKSEAESIVVSKYWVNKSDKDYDYFVDSVLADLVKAKMRENLSKVNTKAVSSEEETLPISQVTSSSMGLKTNSQRVDLSVDVDNLDNKIDRRNQIFKLKEDYIEVEDEFIRDVSFKYAYSFKSFYWVSDGRISVGEERPELKSGQFSLYNRGIMNKKKRDSLAFAGAKVLGCLPEEISFVWYEKKPHMMNESTRALLEINIVDGKAYGFKDGVKHI